MATAPSTSSDKGEIQKAMAFSSDESDNDSNSSSSSISTFDGEGDDSSRLAQLMESISVKQDPVAVINAEKMKLNKKIEKFGVKKLEFETKMGALVKMANDLTEQDKKLKEERDDLTSLKAARLGESQKKITELKNEISGLKGKIEEVKAQSNEYNKNHNAIMEDISGALIADEPLFRTGGNMMISYTNISVKEMDKSSKDFASLD